MSSSTAPEPLGATVGTSGTRFGVHAPDADRVQVCLIDERGQERRQELDRGADGDWTGIVAGVTSGQRYGYRAWGRWEPRRGLRLNPHKLLVDPYTRQIAGDIGDPDRLLGYADNPFGEPSDIDSLGHVPLSVVTEPVRPAPTWLDTPWERTVIMELHVGSYTATHRGVSPAERGSYLGLAAEPVVEHLRRIGVTAVELLPVQAFATEPPVRARGMRNHWGYAPAAYFAPHPGYATAPGRERAEFATMVDRLHDAGIEVILDVVYNHTCEGDVAGPTVSWRGLDAPGYYLLDEHGDDIELTGCGNSVNAFAPVTVRLIRDSLRYWATEFGVDGFRFDLASDLGRSGHTPFQPDAPALEAIAADPILRLRKLIAEPWDATGGGYSLGRFDRDWAEWNDRFRDTVRHFWIGGGRARELAGRLSGSPDVFGPGRAWSSIDFVTAHDGFTMADLVSYAHKHNEANGEDNRDGSNHNLSVNHGVEGPTDDPAIVAARQRHVRALLATLLLTAGTPMLLGGDESGNSQHGNNNAYCVAAGSARTDAWPVTWPQDEELVAYVARLTALRRELPLPRTEVGLFDAGGSPIDGDPEHLLSLQVRLAPGWWMLVQADGTGEFTPATAATAVLDSTAPDGTPSPPGSGPYRLTGPAVVVLRESAA